MQKRNEQYYGLIDHAVAHRKGKPKRTFLDDVEELIDWASIEKFLNKKLNRKANVVGSPPYPALMMFKILLLQQWYGLSDPVMEEALYDRISFVKFIKYSLDLRAPDETTICRFRNGLICLNVYEELLNMINIQFETKGLFVREGAIVDASVVKSAERPRKSLEVSSKIPHDRNEDNTQESFDSKDTQITYSRDKDAKWLCKRNEFIYGYKVHASVDSKLGMVLTGHCTSANKSDTGEFKKVVCDSKIMDGASVFADKGYASLSNREFLVENQLNSKIMHKAKRNKALTEEEKQENRAISKIRFIVERTFGCLKKHYKFQRAKYIGVAKVQAEFLLISIAHNIKKAVNYCA